MITHVITGARAARSAAAAVGQARLGLVAAALAAMFALGTGAAYAQPQVPNAPAPRDPRAVGPYRGLFGGNSLDPNSRDSLDLVGGLFGGYDDNVTARSSGLGGGGSLGDPRAAVSSSYGGASAALRYARNVAERVGFQAGANVTSAYYPDLDDLWATAYGANAALSWRLGPRSTLGASQSFRFSPFFGFALFPVPGGVGDEVDSFDGGPDTRVVQRDNFQYATSVSFARDLSARSAFQASANWRRTDFTGEAAGRYRDREYWGGAARWSYRLTRNAAARLGYGYRTGAYGAENERRLDSHTIDAGIDYGRSLSFSRRTRFSFGTGTAIYSRSRDGIGELGSEYRFTAVGNATLLHELGRSWTAAAAYNRGVRLVDGFSEAFITDTVSLNVGGFLGQRSRLSLASGIHWGHYGTSRRSRRPTSVAYVTPSYQFALSRHLALQASYFYYRYSFDEGSVVLPEGFLPEYARQGYRLTLSYWIPLLVSGAR